MKKENESKCCCSSKNKAGKSKEYRDSEAEGAQGVPDNDPANTEPGTLEDEVRLVNPDVNSMESRG